MLSRVAAMAHSWQPRFLTIWTGQALSRFGSEVVSFALIWWLTDKTGSEAVLATATLMTLLPPVILGPVAGALVDRWSRRKVMIVSDGTIALFTAVLVVLYWRGLVQPWHLYGIMLVRAIGATFHGPSMKASTTLMVPKEQLGRVAGMNQTLSGALRIAAPPAGALLIAALPMHLVASIDVITAAFAIVPLLFIAIPQPESEAGPKRAWGVVHETVEGLRYVSGNRLLFFIVMSCAVTNISYGPVMAFGPLLVKSWFHGGALELGMVSSAGGIGIIAGGLFMTAWGGMKNKVVNSAIGWLGIGLAYIAVAWMPGTAILVYVASKVFVGFMVPVGSAPLDAWYQSHVPPDKQGRVFAVLGSLDQLTMPVGLAVGGALGGVVSLRFWWVLMGIQHALLGISWLALPFVRRSTDGAQATRVAT
jgi:MFS transporter, DHA3 family, macrolide efflux protein